MMNGSTLLERATSARKQLFRDPKCHAVTAEEYCKMLISRAKLERSDETMLKLVGLRDPQTGHRYFVEAERLGVIR